MTEQEKVQAVLNKIRPSLQADGGDIELVQCQRRHCQRQAAGPLRRLSDVPDDD
jgi:hypothetical protein